MLNVENLPLPRSASTSAAAARRALPAPHEAIPRPLSARRRRNHIKVARRARVGRANGATVGAVGGRQPARRRRKRRLRQDTLQRSACQRHAGADGSQQGSGERGSSGRPRSRGGGRGRQEHPPPPWGARGAGGRGAYKIARGWTKAVFCVVREANATHGSKSATAEHWRGNETPNGAKQ